MDFSNLIQGTRKYFQGHPGKPNNEYNRICYPSFIEIDPATSNVVPVLLNVAQAFSRNLQDESHIRKDHFIIKHNMNVQPKAENLLPKIPLQLYSESSCQSMQLNRHEHFDKQNVSQVFLPKSDSLESVYRRNRISKQFIGNQPLNPHNFVKATDSDLVQQKEHHTKHEIKDKKVSESVNNFPIAVLECCNDSRPNFDSDSLPDFQRRTQDHFGMREGSSNSVRRYTSLVSENTNFLRSERRNTFPSNELAAAFSVIDEERFSSVRIHHTNTLGFQENEVNLLKETVHSTTKVPTIFYVQPPAVVSSSQPIVRHSSSSNVSSISRILNPSEHSRNEAKLVDNMSNNYQIMANSPNILSQQMIDAQNQFNQPSAYSLGTQISSWDVSQNISSNDNLNQHNQSFEERTSQSVGGCRAILKESTEHTYYNNTDCQPSQTAVHNAVCAFVPSYSQYSSDSRRCCRNRYSKTSPHQYSSVEHTESSIELYVKGDPAFTSVLKQPSNGTIQYGTATYLKEIEAHTGEPSNNINYRIGTAHCLKRGLNIADKIACSNFNRCEENLFRPTSVQDVYTNPMQPTFSNYKCGIPMPVIKAKQINNHIPVFPEKHCDTISLRLKSEVKQTLVTLSTDTVVPSNATILQKWDPIVSDKKWEEWQNSFNTEWNAFLKDLAFSENIKRVYRVTQPSRRLIKRKERVKPEPNKNSLIDGFIPSDEDTPLNLRRKFK